MRLYLPLVIKSEGPVSSTGTRSIPGPAAETGAVLVVNQGAYVSWRYEEVWNEARSNIWINGPALYLPLIFDTRGTP